MALSRTARILIAILLLAAAAFFWVNFFYQSRLAEVPAQDPVTATPLTPTPAAADAADGAGAQANEAEPTDAQVGEADAAGAATDPSAPAEATPSAAEGDAADAVVVAGEPPVVALDVPVTVTREVVIADLPFLVTSPIAQAVIDAAAAAEETERAGPVTVPGRATINPFSPVVVRTPPAPTREIPPAIVAVGSAPVAGSAPAPAPAVVTRAPAPTPRPLAPSAPTATALTRELPTGSVLSSTPDLLRQPRVGTVAERVDLPSVTTIALPAAEPAVVAPPPTPRTPVDAVDLDPVRVLGMPVVPDGVTVELLPTGPDEATLAAEAAAAEAEAAAAEAAAEAAAREAEAGAAALAAAVAEGVERELAERAAAEAARAEAAEAAGAEAAEAAGAEAAEAAGAEAAVGADPDAVGDADAASGPAAAGSRTNGVSSAPLPAGTTQLARYLRDNNYVFTGSVMGPVSVGVFRSQLEATPVVVALGQTLPNTEIVLTDLRGMQAELTLDDSSQILSLDLRR